MLLRRVLPMLAIGIVGCQAVFMVTNALSAPKTSKTPYKILAQKASATVASSNHHDVAVGIRFKVKERGTIRGLRFYKSSKTPSAHAGILWTAKGKLLARAIFRHETRKGWQSVTFAKPVSVAVGKVYVAGYFAYKSKAADARVRVAFHVKSAPSKSTASNTSATAATTANTANSKTTAATPATIPPKPVVCNLNATTSNFTAQVAAATPGQTVCLAAGNYGNWAGTSKAAPGITITTQPAAAVTMGFQFTLANTQNFTVDGGANGGSISTPNGAQSFEGNSTTARNITIQNVSFVGNDIDVDIDGPANSNITFNHDLFSGSDCMTAGSGVAIHLSYSGSAPSGVTVENSTIENGSSDGIQSGTAMTILNNYFYNLIETSAEMSACHTDAIQFYGMTGGQTVIEGNWFVNTSDGIGSWNGDNAPGYIIENNVFDHQTEESAIALHLDNGSQVIHNTCIDASDACLDLTGLSGQPSVGTVVKDNIFDTRNPYDLTYADPASKVDNMDSSGATGSDFTGTPTFNGGTSFPFAGAASYLLTAGSAGHDRADDGTNVGTTGLPQTGYGPQTS